MQAFTGHNRPQADNHNAININNNNGNNGNNNGDVEEVEEAVVRGQPSAPHYLRGVMWLLTMYIQGGSG